MNGNGSRNKRAKNESATDWIKNMSPNKVIGDAQRILKTAVDVLEEEIAAGILAAKRLEKKVINVDEVRSANPEELMSRVRRDVHDAVDIFLDAVTALTNHFSSLTETFTSTKETAVAKKTETNIPVVKNDSPVKAGETAELSIMLTNDSPDNEMRIEFMKPDLVSQNENKIYSRHIKLKPNDFVLSPLDKKAVIIKIKVPLACRPGVYSGLLLDNQNPDIKTVITLEVE